MTIISQVVRRPDSTYPVVVKPYKLDLSQFGEKVRSEMKFTITNVSDQDLNVTLIDFPAGFATVDLPATVEAGKSAEGKLTLTAEALEQSFEKSLTFELNDESTSRFTVPIKRSIRKPPATDKAAVKAADKAPGK